MQGYVKLLSNVIFRLLLLVWEKSNSLNGISVCPNCYGNSVNVIVNVDSTVLSNYD